MLKTLDYIKIPPAKRRMVWFKSNFVALLSAMQNVAFFIRQYVVKSMLC